ncbi:PREDICTED: gastrin-releasing peptide receptor [Vollenhovia emeryi]|uniref:gastrin-releasing peptide receptor n=1 Tax=Vollenhovia emeryi TaxID=411798 RepID=UPI0005F4325D|nr:PREDICTED: gastrin-releasing peptide receptor [Vollenhovia emeryi]XP_011878936.1 PREDICTED: gastrin-releasing peptide receptor [Vollenhovia emeryi]XP_011878937.1 PREDICTED: gastrin-releasing peptide receptor [Vollenhovia emeryi]
MAMSWPYATSASPSSSITIFMMTTRLTPLALITNYTEVNDSSNITKDINEEEEEYTPYSDRPETYIVPIVFLLILLIGLTGNGVLALTILRHTNMRNVPNTYVLSLALGDLLVIVTCIPFTFTVYILDSWPFGLVLCKLSECAKDISIGVSVFTLTALSADRFFAIVDPMRKLHVTGSGRRATRFTAIVAVLIWVLAIICAIPATFSYIRVFRVNPNISFCVCYPFPEEFGPNYPKVILICRFFIYYLIPLSIIAVFYMLMARHLMRSTRNILGEMQGQVKQIQARKKVAKMVMAFVIVFAVCFFPQHVFMLWFYIHPTAQKDYNAFWHYFRILGFCLAFTNSCINPIALYCVSGTFRKYFDRYLLCCATKRMRRRHRRSSDLSSRGRGQSFSLVSSRKYLGDSRREQRSVMRLSMMAGDIRSTTPIKEQETTITLSAYPNGIDESLRNQRAPTESTVHDRLVT